MWCPAAPVADRSPLEGGQKCRLRGAGAVVFLQRLRHQFGNRRAAVAGDDLATPYHAQLPVRRGRMLDDAGARPSGEFPEAGQEWLALVSDGPFDLHRSALTRAIAIPTSSCIFRPISASTARRAPGRQQDWHRVFNFVDRSLARRARLSRPATSRQTCSGVISAWSPPDLCVGASRCETDRDWHSTCLWWMRRSTPAHPNLINGNNGLRNICLKARIVWTCSNWKSKWRRGCGRSSRWSGVTKSFRAPVIPNWSLRGRASKRGRRRGRFVRMSYGRGRWQPVREALAIIGFAGRPFDWLDWDGAA